MASLTIDLPSQDDTKTLLWLDDARNPYENDWLNFSCLSSPFCTVWVTSYNDFVGYIQQNGLPDGINFDHDLLPEHYTPESLWNDYAKSKAWQDYNNVFGNGYDCAVWLVDFCKSNNLKLPSWRVHSSNPVGANNIRGILTWYDDFWRKNNNEV